MRDLATAQHEPRQFHDEHGEVFIFGYERVSGPDDAHMRRRVVGTGRSRASARASAVRALSRWDSTYHIVSSR